MRGPWLLGIPLHVAISHQANPEGEGRVSHSLLPGRGGIPSTDGNP